jgi:hypothetical protein
MRRLAFARRALLSATAGAAVVLPVVLAPPAAWAEAPNPSACRGLYHGNPPGSLVMTTNPSSATVLHPGDEVEVTATWDTADWPRPILHKVLDCLLVNGEIDYEHSSQEKPTDNDGYYRYRFTVPNGARGRICDRVRLSGRFVEDGDLVVQKSNTICFSIAAVAGNTGAPGVGPGGPADEAGELHLPPPMHTEAGELHLPPPMHTSNGDGPPAPLQPLGPVAEAPAPDPAVPVPPLELSAISFPMLPRTGADPFPLVRVGALLVLLGGVALIARVSIPRPCPRS